MPNFGKYFVAKEFDSPDLPGSSVNMKQELLDKLNAAREIAGIPFKINSGFRTVLHNKKVGGEANSSHCRGFAADLAYRNGTTGYKILKACMDVGLKRIGVYRTWIHVDCDPDLPTEVIWSK